MTTARTLACAIVLTQSLAACELLGPSVCTTDVKHAVIIEVRDAVTGAPAAAGATGFVQDGDFRAALDASAGFTVDSLFLYGPFQRVGTYRVVVDRPGYHRWTREDVRVRRDECHVQTVRLKADLQPQP